MKKHWVSMLLLAMLVCATAAWAQVSTSTISGTVMDKSGAVVADAKVTVTNEGTNVSYTTTTTSVGAYTFPSMVVGSYTITVEMTGFQKWVSTKNKLSVGAPLIVNATLEVGAVTSVVQVEASYQRLETSSATVSDVMTEKQIKNLPLNGRNPLSLLTLEPGVVQRTAGGAGSGTHVFGSRDRAHNVTIDGIDANESTVPNPQSNLQRLNPDNVQEFRTITLNATAENGRNSGANVMIATKSGSNDLHGDAFYFNRNTALLSNEFFNKAFKQPRPDLKLNQWGFDVGGPIWKNHTFFFGSYQGNIIKQSAPIASFFGVPAVYTQSLKNGIFRFVRGTVTNPSGKAFSQNDRQLVDSSGNLLSTIPLCAGILGGTVTTNCVDGYAINAANDPLLIGFDPAVAAFITTLPLPNNFIATGDGLNTGGFAWNPPTKFTGPHIMVRVDHNFGPNDNIFVRWLQNRYNTGEGDFINSRPRVYPGFPPLGEVGRLGKNLAISYRHTFSPRLVNELTLGFNRFVFNFTFGESNPNFGDPTKVPPWADSCIYGSFGLITGPYCVSPHTARAITTPQVVDNITWQRGAHTFRAGINFRFYIHNDSRGFFGSTILAPGILFNGGSTARRGNFANIPSTASSVPAAQRPNSTDINNLQQAIVELAGIPFSLRQSFRADFIADQYVTAKYATVYTRAHQYNSYLQDEWRLRPGLVLNLGVRWEFNPAPYDKQQSLAPDHALDGSQGLVTYVKTDRWFKNNNIKAIAPRVGLAWSPDTKTSVRAGYALLFDTLSTFQATAIAGKMPGFMLLCNQTIDTAGTISTSTGCSTASGMTTSTRISSSFPLSIPAPTVAPSSLVTPAVTSSGQAPSIGAFQQDMKNPAVHEWNLTIQRELPYRVVAEVGYIGKRGTHLYRAYDLNQIDPSAQLLADFKIGRANFLAGCQPDGTGCPAGVTGQTLTFLPTLVTSAFINSSTSQTDFRQGGIGNFIARMDALATNSTQRFGVASGQPPTIPPTFNLRPNGQFSQIFYQDAGGDSYYHGMYVAVRRRYERGLDLGFSYTLSKSIDVMSVDPTGAATGGGLSTTSFQRTPTDVHNFRLDRSRSDFDNRHVILANVLYDLPFGRGRRWAPNPPGWLNQIIGGWSLTSILVYQSGEPYTLSSGVRTTNSTHVSTGIIVGPPIGDGSLRDAPGITGPVLFRTGGPITSPLTHPFLNCQNILGTGSFICVPQPGANGVGRNTMQGPHYRNVDAGLLKIFNVTERLNVQFRVEAFNVFNHPNFENPRNATSGSATVTSSAFGQTCCATAAVASAQQVNPIGEPMRVVQLGLKITF